MLKSSVALLCAAVPISASCSKVDHHRQPAPPQAHEVAASEGWSFSRNVDPMTDEVSFTAMAPHSTPDRFFEVGCKNGKWTYLLRGVGEYPEGSVPMLLRFDEDSPLSTELFSGGGRDLGTVFDPKENMLKEDGRRIMLGMGAVLIHSTVPRSQRLRVRSKEGGEVYEFDLKGAGEAMGHLSSACDARGSHGAKS